MPVLRRTVLAFLEHPGIDHVMVVMHPDDEDLYLAAVKGLKLLPPTTGDETRAQSVEGGVKMLMAGSEVAESEIAHAIVLVHDAVRPLVTARLIDRCLARIRQPGDGEIGVVPALPMNDSLRRGGDRLNELIDRSNLLRVQTPQCFRLVDLYNAFDHAELDQLAPTDEAGMMLGLGHQVAVVEGEERNFKLTSAEDFERADAMLAQAQAPRVGIGFDVHALAAGEDLWLGGVQIPHDRGLAGHSDADVVLHAITDAILGALGAGDIGDHFPPSDPRWRGATSSLFLEHARELVEQAGGRIAHVDATIICEAPKIGPHRDDMRARIAALLRLPAARTSVKATTTERLGFAGRGEGIACQAVATLLLPEDG